ncbi:MAG TPA: GNAT family N-acetyltransferase [Solirubrobacteraceae bacterium]|nr:GNAT family N-acetyltransferase [Solirubrobacteraceae bacterium]
MSAAVEVRRAHAADEPELARMLARAFHDDPVAEWACRSEAARPRMLERFQGTRVRQLLPHEEVWASADLSCAALWAPPGRWKTTVREDLAIMRCMLQPRMWWRTPLIASGMLGLEARHPSGPPHYYLAVLGTDPPRQGEGLGSALLAPVLERCDHDGVGAFLESSKERNVDFYARHGFRVTDEIRLPRGPKMWQMWRDPRP